MKAHIKITGRAMSEYYEMDSLDIEVRTSTGLVYRISESDGSIGRFGDNLKVGFSAEKHDLSVKELRSGIMSIGPVLK